MKTTPAHLLVFHGSRNQQYAVTISKLASLVKSQIKSHSDRTQTVDLLEPLVDIAVLELSSLSLAESIVHFCQKAIALNYEQVQIVPIFLSGGIHVTQDIPEEVQQARQNLGNKIKIQLLDYLGSDSQITKLLRQKFQEMNTSGKILLAHGSRLLSGNVVSEQLAQEINAINAYWTIQPNLKTAVQLLVKQDIDSIAIVPYFLFSGRITEAIASHVTELQALFPQTQLLLAQPLGATPELAQVITSKITSQS